MGKRLLCWSWVGVGIAALCIGILSGAASAHVEQRAGPYAIEIGWVSEPSIVGVLNGVYMEVHAVDANDTRTPVEGAEASLSARVSTGNASTVKAFGPAGGESGPGGIYIADLLPSREGVYTVVISGTLNGTAVNLTYTLETVESRLDVEFPIVDPSPGELAQNASEQQALIAQLQEENAQLRSQVGAPAPSALDYVAFALAAAGLGLAGVALQRSRPKP